MAQGEGILERFLYPEEKLAQLWVRKLSLEHPINILDVVSKFADIHYDSFPFDADAVLISEEGTQRRPVIFLESSLAENRKTFTLAHELGHLLIPWHTGNFACTPVESLNFPEYFEEIHREIERQANRFAAEFLIPSVVVDELLAEGESVEQIIERFARGRISKIAISYKLLKTLPTGYLMVEVDPFDEVVSSGKTDRTFLAPPSVGDVFSENRYSAIGATINTMHTSYDRRIHWVDLRSVSSERPSTDGLPESKEILLEIINDLQFRDCRASINGIVGSANSMWLRSPDSDLYTILTERCRNRENLKEVIDHPDFQSYLAKKAEEIEERYSG